MGLKCFNHFLANLFRKYCGSDEQGWEIYAFRMKNNKYFKIVTCAKPIKTLANLNVWATKFCQIKAESFYQNQKEYGEFVFCEMVENITPTLMHKVDKRFNFENPLRKHQYELYGPCIFIEF